jgi:hypothetical protein
VTNTCDGPAAGVAAGPSETSRLATERFDNAKTAAPAQGQNRAVREARLKLLREVIFENLGAAKLFIEIVQLLIEGRDDTGARHSLRMGALHFKAAIQSSPRFVACMISPEGSKRPQFLVFRARRRTCSGNG